ncbi:hypothetical protein ABT112_08445 [Streptomyces sp. NPDC002055]|uniref:hypothetical protein n=1 Tax=Streptomyces sp. NPDC002055 TaxID=3154534 RepID=UPI00331F9565
MALLAEYSVNATLGRHIVEVYDADAHLGDETAMDAAEQQVVAGNGYHLYLYSLQLDIDAQINIRIWDAPRQPPIDSEGAVQVVIESETGILVVNQLSIGPAGQMSLPRPGVYEGHAWWSGRQATADYYHDTLDHLAEDSPDGVLQRAWRSSPTAERYVLDLAYTRPSEPVDDDDSDL